jgi:tripartite-type tricarboxylate transporter receptor subunit TctC
MTFARLRAALAFLLAFPLAFLAAPLGAALAQEWPAHPLRIIVPFPAGGSADAQTRVIADELGRALGQPVIVENKPGAGGNLGAAAAAHAASDGYTLFMATTGTHASNISLYKTLPYDPVKDFAPLTLVTINPQVIAAGPAFGGLDLAGVIARLKSAGAASYGSSGIGSATHLAGALFVRETGTALTHVPYRGQGPALNDLIGGRIEMMFPLVADVLSFVRAGKLNAAAIMDTRRAAALPNVPTTAELGLPRLALTPIWTALYTNAGVPAPIVDRLHRELTKIIASPAFVDKLAAAGYTTRTSTPQELGALAAGETAKWRELVQGLGVQLE